VVKSTWARGHAEASHKPASRTARPHVVVVRRVSVLSCSRQNPYRHNVQLSAQVFTAKPSKPDVSVMSSDRVLDYLTEEIVVAKNIVRPIM
jgi:hypothetical protein